MLPHLGQVLPPLEAAQISIAPDDVLLPAGNISAVVEGLLVVQVAATSVCWHATLIYCKSRQGSQSNPD